MTRREIPWELEVTYNLQRKQNPFFFGLFFVIVVFEMRSQYVALAELELTEIFLPCLLSTGVKSMGCHHTQLFLILLF